MTDVKGLLLEVLEAYGYPVILQGTLSQDAAYPPAFFTFWNNATNDQSFYDNDPTVTVWDFDVNFYATDTGLVNAQLLSAKSALRGRGFIVNGAGYDIASDEPTHTGCGINAIYIDREG